MKRTGTTRRRFLAASLAGLVIGQLGTVSEARAVDEPVAGEVLVILGHAEGAGVDPALSKLAALQKAPFDSFPKKTLLSRAALSLSIGKETEVELPNGRKLRLQLLERTNEGRYRVSLSINHPGKKDYLPLMTVAAAPGDPFFVAGQKHEGGTLIIGVRVGKSS